MSILKQLILSFLSTNTKNDPTKTIFELCASKVKRSNMSSEFFISRVMNNMYHNFETRTGPAGWPGPGTGSGLSKNPLGS
jgi:hypothetical protein